MKRVLLFLGCVAPTLAEVTPGVAQLPEIEAPPESQIHLGQMLFWDPILSGERDVACATCHHPDFAWADGRDLSLGPGATGLGPERTRDSDHSVPVVGRNAPTILNTAFNGLGLRRGRRGRGGGGVLDPGAAPMFWDNRIASLEAQALEPIKAFEEMRGAHTRRTRPSTA